MKIGIIGLGDIGGTLARLWARAGHELYLSSRDPSKHADLARELGPRARLTDPEEAARHGDVVLISIPLGELPRLSDPVREALQGKIVMDTSNPYAERDGGIADQVMADPGGTGAFTARQLPGARIVRAFNTVPAEDLLNQVHRKGEPIGIPLASDDQEALGVVSQLVRDAGHGPVAVGALRRAKEFDRDTPPYASSASVSEVERMLGLGKKAAA